MSQSIHNPDASRAFVVLLHQTCGGDHYDLMIDRGEFLATWQVPLPPEQAIRRAIACTRIADHRRAYLDYEGPISGDRGHVRRHDTGQCILDYMDDVCWRITFAGRLLRGRMELRRASVDADQWSLSSIEA